MLKMKKSECIRQKYWRICIDNPSILLFFCLKYVKYCRYVNIIPYFIKSSQYYSDLGQFKSFKIYKNRGKMILQKRKQEDTVMMDLIMIAVLAGSVGLIYLLIGWCQKQVDRSE